MTDAPGASLDQIGTRPGAAIAAAAYSTLGFAVVAGWLPVDGAARTVLVLATGAAGATAICLYWFRKHLAGWVRQASSTAEEGRLAASLEASGSAARLQAIFHTATEGIVSIDAAGIIENVNGAAVRLFGHAAEEMVGRNVSMLMPEPFHTEHDGYLRRYAATGERRIIGIGREVLGKRKDGTLFPIDLSVGEGRNGDRRFFTAVIRDITERKQMQSKLAQTERLAAVGELAAGVAHEVNNPVNTIINCAQLIADGDDPKENCQVIIEEGERIADIVKDLLQFARDDNDRAQPTSLQEVVQRTLRLIGENFKRHGIALRVELPEQLPPVLARPQQIQQVLLNLLINAKDALLAHSGNDKQVRIACEPTERHVVLSVVDNGPGIPESLGERIFEPFVTTKRARGGTGLGLSVSRSIVEGYHGTLTVVSAPGHGATFRIRLPCADRNE